ncbi:MAG: CHRD domain-containing protein [Chloroflexi bacterium]|nr:CHRD domain-containing protein [Chloroflexota bacterium]
MKAHVKRIGAGLAGLAVLGGVAATIASPLSAQREPRNFGANLNSIAEVPSNITNGTGALSLRQVDNTQLVFTLQYNDLEGGAPTAAHIHIGQTGVNGGVSVFFCGGGNKPACPPAGQPAIGVITAADITGPTAQGVAAGDLAKLLRAIRAGVAYANVHNATFSGGEIRGQITTVAP